MDTTFSIDGLVTTAIGSGADVGNSVAVQADGKIVVVGSSNNGTDDDFAVVRYNANGALDTTFGGTGKVTTAIGLGNDVGTTVAIQNDGKIVVAGYAVISGNSDFAVVRYNADGSLDSTFGGTGKVTIGFVYLYDSNIDDYAYGVAVQSDGKIVIVGSAGGYYNYDGNGEDIAVVRCNANGTLDTSFGGGKVRTNIYGGSFGSKDVARSVAVQEDGKIVVAGEHGSSYTNTTINRCVSAGVSS